MNKEREKHLLMRIEELERDKCNLLDRIQVLNQHKKVEKIQNEQRHVRQLSKLDVAEEFEACNQQIYMLQTDLRKIDSEMNSQQKTFVGILNGIRQDFWDILGNYVNERDTGPLDSRTVKRLQAMGERLNSAYTLAANGDLSKQSVKKEFPHQYSATTDKEIIKPPVRKLSISYIARNALTGHLVGSSSSSRSETPAAPAVVSNGCHQNGEPRTYRKPQHPSLIDPISTGINYTKITECFPFMTKEFVECHWANFQDYDTNQDGFLDLRELLDAALRFVDGELSAAEVQEALLEMDTDGSNRIDFYEYLTTTSMLQQKGGRAGIFKTRIVEDKRPELIKSCLVM